jgi:hypothetical protein
VPTRQNRSRFHQNKVAAERPAHNVPATIAFEQQTKLPTPAFTDEERSRRRDLVKTRHRPDPPTPTKEPSERSAVRCGPAAAACRGRSAVERGDRAWDAMVRGHTWSDPVIARLYR